MLVMDIIISESMADIINFFSTSIMIMASLINIKNISLRSCCFSACYDGSESTSQVDGWCEQRQRQTSTVCSTVGGATGIQHRHPLMFWGKLGLGKRWTYAFSWRGTKGFMHFYTQIWEPASLHFWVEWGHLSNSFTPEPLPLMACGGYSCADARWRKAAAA